MLTHKTLLHRAAISAALALTLIVAVAPSHAAIPSRNPQGCVTNYRPGTDYFPAKSRFVLAKGVQIEYRNHYKLIKVTRPWPGATETFNYALVQCGTPVPTDLPPNTTVVEIPVRRVIAMSTTQLPHLDRLGLLDRLIGLDEFTYVQNENVRRLIRENRLVEISPGGLLQVEKAIAAKPDLIMTFAVGDPQFDAHPKLLEAGLKAALNAEWVESTPLGRAEWIKFTAAFFNAEDRANREFGGIVSRYRRAALLARNVSRKPTVLVGLPQRDRWFVPGGESYAATLLKDAGADYLFAEDRSSGSVLRTFEEVYARGVNADVWLLNAFGSFPSTAAVTAVDQRLNNIRALRTGKVWNYDARTNENGGNDYWETGVTNPDIILRDLVAIFHPTLLPNHKFVFYRQLPAD